MERTKREQYYLDIAAKVAITSECRFKLGCVVVKHNRILGSSPNVFRNNPLNVPSSFCSIHAEVRALRRARFPRKATLYVVRINRQGERRKAAPCSGCLSLIEELKCKVVHT